IASLEQRARSISRSKKRKELGLSVGTAVIITVGELNANKNHIQVLKALSKLTKTNFHYLIVGNGESEQKLKKAVNELMLQDKVSFLGFRRDVPELLTASDVFILTSRREGLPKAVLEAMAIGLPIIATDVRGNRDLVKSGENGYLVPVDDVETTSQVIKKLISSPELRNSMQEKNKEKARAYALDRILPQMEKIYEYILKT
ncbi:MAG TPA: glycosyltransferase family 4 protein, partial [Clostridiales bacterium]|nr:glycosyltransferase family 4 protein [Clostridiales bacterium]